MNETHRGSVARAAAGRFLALGLAGITAFFIAQACATTPPVVGDGAEGNGGSVGTGGGTGGHVSAGGSGGSGGPMTGGSGGTATGGEDNGGSAGEGGLGGQGGAFVLELDGESSISTIYSLPSSVLGGVILIDREESCEDFVAAGEADAYWGNSKSLLFTFGDKDRTELEPGAYPVTNLPAPEDGKYGSATFGLFDSACAIEALPATSGTITIDSVVGDEISGSYDLEFAVGTLSGTFSPEPCPDYAWMDNTPPTTCY